ncbi:unnamed protein product, partial [Staurois parvus]
MLRQDNKNSEMSKVTTTDKDCPETDIKKDEELILKEMEEAQDTLKQLQDILQKLYYTEDDSNNNYPVSEETAEDSVSSEEWLTKFGLKPHKLLFHDALADCAFRHSDGVVDIKTKPEDESVQT